MSDCVQTPSKPTFSMQDIHPGRNCTECSLCSSPLQQATHPANWKSEQVSCRLHLHTPLPLPLSACICRPCAENIRKNIGNENYHPRWKPHAPKQIQYCMVEGCTNTAAKCSHPASKSETSLLLHCPLKESTVDNDTLPLCNSHYSSLYDNLRRKPCVQCQINPPRGTNFTHTSPNPVLLTAYLHSHTDFIGTIGERDKLCKTCYNFQLSVTQEATTVSLDEDLKLKLHKLRQSVELLSKSQRENADNEFYLTWATEATCIFVAENLIANRALLLPDIVRYFTAVLCSNSKLLSATHPQTVSNPPTSQWLISRLTTFLAPHIAFCCKILKMGTIVYRKGGDVMTALTYALHNASQLQKRLSILENQPMPPSPKFEEQFDNVCSTLNKALVSQNQLLSSTQEII